MPFGQLVDEAERAVVVAGAHAVEHRARRARARAARRRPSRRRTELLEAAAAQLELDDGLVGLDLVADDVAHRLAVEREQLVAGEEPGGVGRRTGRDRHHAGGRHRVESRSCGRAPALAWCGARRTRAARRAPRVLRGRGDGDQGAVVDGAASSSRPCTATTRSSTTGSSSTGSASSGRGLRRRRRRRARRRAAHALGPRLGARGGRRGPRPGTASW